MLLLIGNKDVPLNISQEKERDVLYKGDILTILPFNYEPTRAEIDTYIFIEVDLTPEEIDALLTPLLEDQLLLEEEHLTGQVFQRKAKRKFKLDVDRMKTKFKEKIEKTVINNNIIDKSLLAP